MAKTSYENRLLHLLVTNMAAQPANKKGMGKTGALCDCFELVAATVVTVNHRGSRCEAAEWLQLVTARRSLPVCCSYEEDVALNQNDHFSTLFTRDIVVGLHHVLKGFNCFLAVTLFTVCRGGTRFVRRNFCGRFFFA